MKNYQITILLKYSSLKSINN